MKITLNKSHGDLMIHLRHTTQRSISSLIYEALELLQQQLVYKETTYAKSKEGEVN